MAGKIRCSGALRLLAGARHAGGRGKGRGGRANVWQNIGMQMLWLDYSQKRMVKGWLADAMGGCAGISWVGWLGGWVGCCRSHCGCASACKGRTSARSSAAAEKLLLLYFFLLAAAFLAAGLALAAGLGLAAAAAFLAVVALAAAVFLGAAFLVAVVFLGASLALVSCRMNRAHRGRG
jgi:hypothetical protein